MFQKDICEMKRLYVCREFRGLGIGYRLCRSIIAKARTIGDKGMRLDMLERLEEANRLYTRMGFEEIPPYRANPEPGARFMEYLL
jgi:GNAT superfamily N-acetyltransferase